MNEPHTKPLSVIHILSSLRLGGAERVTIELAKVQRARGLDAQILSLGSEQDFLVAQVRGGDIPLTISASGSGRLGRYRQLVRIAKRFDVIHVHSPRTLAYLVPILPLLSRRRVIYTRHGLDPLSSLKWKLVHALARPCIDRVSFVTRSGYDVFRQHHRWPAKRLVVINNGVVLPQTGTRKATLPLRFGSVGRMVTLKGQHHLLNAIPLLAAAVDGPLEEYCQLHFFGSGPVENDLKQQVADLSIDIVTFHGEQSDIDQIYDQIDVLVVTSQSEGLSMVIIEAMARRIPAIATDVGGNPSLVIAGETGLLIPYGSPDAISRAMLTFIAKPELADQLGSTARGLVASKFSMANTYEQYLACYSDSP